MSINLDVNLHIERLKEIFPFHFKYENDYLFFEDFKFKLYLDEVSNPETVYTLIEIYLQDNLIVFTKNLFNLEFFEKGLYDYDLINYMKSLVDLAKKFEKSEVDSKQLEYYKSKYKKIGFCLGDSNFNSLFIFKNMKSNIPHEYIIL